MSLKENKIKQINQQPGIHISSLSHSNGKEEQPGTLGWLQTGILFNRGELMKKRVSFDVVWTTKKNIKIP